MTLLVLAGLLAGCAGSASWERELTVLAAASLTDGFGQLEAAFEAAHPGSEVLLSFAGSQVLSSQVRQGIRADVLASANLEHVASLRAEGLLEASTAFAANTLVLPLSEAWPADTDLSTLGAVERLVVGTPEVPVGQYTEALFVAAEARYGKDWREAVESRVVSRESNVRLALARLVMGEVDAAVVYRTDVEADSGLRFVALPPDFAPRAVYHHGRLVDAPNRDLAASWMEFVEGPEGRSVLDGLGFSRPGEDQ